MQTAMASVQFGPAPTLVGQVVRLVPLQPAHVAPLWAAAAPGDIFAWFADTIRCEADMDAFVTTALAESEAGRAVPFAILLAACGTAIGSTRFAALDGRHRRAEIGWTWLGRRWQRSGANRDAKRLMLAHAFEAWRLNRVEFKTDRLNTQSRKALQGIGATEEGLLRSHMVMPDGRLRDSVYASILATEWPAVRDRLACRPPDASAEVP